MRLPGGEDVFIDPRKLVDYALSPSHPDGSNKAKVFLAALGLTASNADLLDAALRLAARDGEVSALQSDIHGDRYRLRFEFHHEGRSAIVTSGWIVPADGTRTRLASVYVSRTDA